MRIFIVSYNRNRNGFAGLHWGCTDTDTASGNWADTDLMCGTSTLTDTMNRHPKNK